MVSSEDLRSNLENSFLFVARKFGNEQLKTFQKDSIEKIVLDKSDVFMCYKTGSGKSLCFQVISTVCE